MSVGVSEGGPPDIAVVGAIALDEIHSAAGDIDQLLGGSAVYASLSASLLASVAPVSVIGDGVDLARLAVLSDRGVQLDGIERAAGPNFRWGCRYSADGDVRETLYTHAGVYDTHPIVVAERIRSARMVLLTAGNPEQNQRAMSQMSGPELVALDTIEREVAEQTEAFRAELGLADIVSINTLEASHLIGWQGDPDDPALARSAWEEIRALGPSVFICKRGSRGVEIFREDERIAVSAAADVAVVDPTGAGDTFIAALLSGLARGWTLVQATVWGCAAASTTIERFGADGIAAASVETVVARARSISVDGAAAAPIPLSGLSR